MARGAFHGQIAVGETVHDVGLETHVGNVLHLALVVGIAHELIAVIEQAHIAAVEFYLVVLDGQDFLLLGIDHTLTAVLRDDVVAVVQGFDLIVGGVEYPRGNLGL